MSRKLIYFLVFVLFVAGLLVAIAWPWYRAIQAPNTQVPGGEEASLFIRDTTDLETLIADLVDRDLLQREGDFRKAARLMEFGETLRPGHYRIKAGLSNRELIGALRSGRQTPMRLTFNRYRHTDRLSARLASNMQFDSSAMAQLLRNPDSLALLDLDENTVLAAFLPNTYEVWWTTTPMDLLRRMIRERERFWDSGNRRQKAEELGLSPLEVTVIASIVEEEQNALPDEWPRIAGLYLNRVRRGMALEADPTIKFAMGDFSIRRVYLRYIDETADSPYNTYRNRGLPPGPICTPSPRAIDAVLNAESHRFLFMCAKADMSGYHAFAETHQQHIRNRNLYTAELNRRGIR